MNLKVITIKWFDHNRYLLHQISCIPERDVVYLNRYKEKRERISLQVKLKTIQSCNGRTAGIIVIYSVFNVVVPRRNIEETPSGQFIQENIGGQSAKQFCMQPRTKRGKPTLFHFLGIVVTVNISFRYW